jgi:hypothetical protein
MARFQCNRREMLGSAVALSVSSAISQHSAAAEGDLSIATELAFDAIIQLDSPVLTTASSWRAPIVGGEVHGPLANGVILPGEIEWRVDSVAQSTQVNARYALQLEDGCIVHVVDSGVAPQQLVPSQAQRMHTAPEFSSDDLHGWAHGSVFLGALDATRFEHGSVKLRVLKVA